MPGFHRGMLGGEKWLAFWTITVWDDEKSMKAFRNSDAHLRVMPRLANWCDEASFVHWEQNDESIPTAELVFQRLRDTGTLSKVRHPSAAHSAGNKTGKNKPRFVSALWPRA
jgi:hypothetical protein